MADDNELLIEMAAVGGGRIDEENGAGGNGGIHRVACNVHADHVLRMRAPGKWSEEHVFDIGLGEAHVLMRRDAIAKGSHIHEWNRYSVASACEVLRNLFTGDEVEVIEGGLDRGYGLAKTGIGQFGGIDTCALPEIGAVGSPCQIAERDVCLSGGLIFSSEPAGDGCGGHAEALGQSRLGQCALFQQSPDTVGPFSGCQLKVGHLGWFLHARQPISAVQLL